ncbi:hypothetical protein [Kangiella sp. TOML190]|uniref:SPW repeat domain-containing protein n=1 Tax=Kangiella sp. TOML190 TaxID=2931351 RepID=UPI00204190DB|nr:hypothetical protein [Kangiella sp. TOML190]
MKFINSKLHGYLDYLAAIGLIALPFVIGLEQQSQLAFYISIVMGFGLIGYSLLSDYALSIKPLISYKGHLVFDLLASSVFILTPWIFGYNRFATLYSLIMGAGVIVVVIFSKANWNDSILLKSS